MTAPNLLSPTTITGETAGTNLSTTTATAVLNNPANSGKCLKVNTLNVSNSTGAAASITVSYNNAENISGTDFIIVGSLVVPAYATITVIDKLSQYYLKENSSLEAIASAANVLSVTISYEDIS